MIGPAMHAVPSPRSSPARGRIGVTVAAVLLALALAVLVIGQLVGQGHRAESGSLTTLEVGPTGVGATVLIPGRSLEIVVGEPVGQIAGEDPDDPLLAPAGGRLLPLSWTLGYPEVPGRGDGDALEVAVVADDERVEVGRTVLSSNASPSTDEMTGAAAFAEPVVLDDLRVEVTFDGLTQVLDVATGEIDAGAAAPLYETPRPALPSSCVPDEYVNPCPPVAVDDSAAWRPEEETVTSASALELDVYDDALGWAEEGTRWATTVVTVDDVSALENASGARVRVSSAVTNDPVATLDGADPAAGRFGVDAGGHTGRLTFAVDDEAVPAELRITQTLGTLSGRGPARLPVEVVVRFVD